jgi:hypothetical protein
VRVGTIGNMPPAIPGGRVPPNFRSVIPTTVPSRTADRALAAPHGATPYIPATANKGASPVSAGADTRAIYGPYAGHGASPSGHVFAPPSHTAAPASAGYGMGGGYGAAGNSGYGMGAGSAIGSSHAMGPSGGHSTGGGSHASGGGHGSPK